MSQPMDAVLAYITLHLLGIFSTRRKSSHFMRTFENKSRTSYLLIHKYIYIYIYIHDVYICTTKWDVYIYICNIT